MADDVSCERQYEKQGRIVGPPPPDEMYFAYKHLNSEEWKLQGRGRQTMWNKARARAPTIFSLLLFKSLRDRVIPSLSCSTHVTNHSKPQDSCVEVQ